ncbi:MAG: ATP-grasp domain-containing protein [Deltaproteobacteria bacterium]|nr:ATP-grasp domain-containing protein [Deltaproteobacteria bacterium]
MKKILIANRGEIARRVIHAAKELGYATVAVYSDPDRDSLAVREADEAFRLAGSEVRETYLDSAKILEIAKSAGVWGVHPGYGFLSENADFAADCSKAGIKFIGPAPEAMRALGSKVASKRLAKQAKVPVVPGFEGELPEGQELQKIAVQIGFPLLIKAAAGGGGKGMRVVKAPEELEEAARSAEREALAFFKDKTIFLEKYLERPRHIEVQILGDEKGNLVHLYERECSVQRRHQKMIEETPSPSITPKFREDICASALRIAEQAGYYSAGTVEFIVDEADNFYFLEVNTRLQVEHPVTEAVTGIDLVKAQIMVAEGHALPFKQEDIRQRGHAIECRLYAEDPENGFLPAEGKVGVLWEPQRPGLRIDSALEAGKPVLSLYDPMLAKLIAVGFNRKEALLKMDALLRDYLLLGIRHNLDFLRYTLNSKPFHEGRYHTHSVAELLEGFLEKRGKDKPAPDLAYAIAAMAGKVPSAETGVSVREPKENPVASLRGFKNA